MALTRNRSFLHALTSNLSAGACNPFRNALSISSVARRFYTPSLTSQLQHTSAGSISPATSQDNSVKPDSDKRTRPSRNTRGQYHLLNTKRPRWTDEEKDMLLAFVHQGYSSQDVYTHFPLRSICSLDTRIARLRSEEQAKGTIEKKPRLGIQKVAWSEKEDEWLVKRLKEYGLTGREEEDISWPVVANGLVDGKSLGRTATSCKRRWVIIDPSSERRHGFWTKEEKDKLANAVRKQLKHEKSALSEKSRTNSTGVRNKLGLALNSDSLAMVDWDDVGKEVQTRSGVQCRSHAYKNLESGTKGRWDESEVNRMREGVMKYGEDWHRVASVVGTRSAFQVRQRHFVVLAKTKQQAEKKAE
ncbi:hypothetical protein BGX24_008208 [Mortierella sp. AD032]|nr:hypothetical protein BGX24_008208 [Mortierella sp. AD032]